MKKLAIIGFVIIISLVTVSVVMAKPGVGNPRGEITDINETAETMTLDIGEGEPYLLVNLPEDFDYFAFKAGDIITAKGEWVVDYFNAEWVKLSDDEEELEVEEPEIEGDESEGEGNAWGEGGVYCAEGGKEEQHPMALKIAEKFGLGDDLSFIMDYVCDGGSFGGVMLALQMGVDFEGGPEAMLELRKGGVGWGTIWKEAGMIGKERGDSPPPGLLKKGDEKPGNGPPDGKGPKN